MSIVGLVLYDRELIPVSASLRKETQKSSWSRSSGERDVHVKRLQWRNRSVIQITKTPNKDADNLRLTQFFL